VDVLTVDVWLRTSRRPLLCHHLATRRRHRSTSAMAVGSSARNSSPVPR
jgi:hypothetical protein